MRTLEDKGTIVDNCEQNQNGEIGFKWYRTEHILNYPKIQVWLTNIQSLNLNAI